MSKNDCEKIGNFAQRNKKPLSCTMDWEV